MLFVHLLLLAALVAGMPQKPFQVAGIHCTTIARKLNSQEIQTLQRRNIIVAQSISFINFMLQLSVQRIQNSNFVCLYTLYTDTTVQTTRHIPRQDIKLPTHPP